ncbi:hypothetical protein RFI_28390 [Reticulomyxa filosa]|uniref:FAD dependent oxidoreductase domain-containing protein n=1 Tax=Reticulomyxa filosa TaxID=46433 RepID=X6M4U1_RETFI|nr:hypothetical protein RFI_28390 [Reticulomyxa filosa]|eukprot:ETO08998.1 hypothetical protein RFI_28390 [Reticulomyxa filosa]
MQLPINKRRKKCLTAYSLKNIGVRKKDLVGKKKHTTRQRQKYLEMTQQTAPLHVVVCGAGALGSATAYYLKEKEVKKKEKGRGKKIKKASGKAGGFLAYDWCIDELNVLAKKSFELHSQIGETYKDQTYYRRLNTYDIKTKTTFSKTKEDNERHEATEWMDCTVDACKEMGSLKTTAQIHPKRLCEIVQTKKKYELVYGAVKGIQFSDDTSKRQQVVTGVWYSPTSLPSAETEEKSSNDPQPTNTKETSRTETNETEKQQQKQEGEGTSNLQLIRCDAVVICMGPWSSQAYQWFPECLQLKNLTGIFVYVYSFFYHFFFFLHQLNLQNRKTGRRTNSVVVKPCKMDAKDIPANAYFVNHVSKDSENNELEIYPRSDGTFYCCGFSEILPLPEDPLHIVCDSKRTQMLHECLGEISGRHLGVDVSTLLTQQACYLPSTSDAIPLIGKITGTNNAFVGTGHTCWGILNSLITGLLLSELIVDGQYRTVDDDTMKAFNPSREYFFEDLTQ